MLGEAYAGDLTEVRRLKKIQTGRGRSEQGKHKRDGWGGRIRTCGTLDQNQMPYHLATPHHQFYAWWLWLDLNQRPQHYECCALTS